MKPDGGYTDHWSRYLYAGFKENRHFSGDLCAPIITYITYIFHIFNWCTKCFFNSAYPIFN